jgi:hypothetical protein
MKKPHDQVGILSPPSSITRVETIDAIEIAARDCQIAGFCAAPIVVVDFAEWSEMQTYCWQQAVDMPPHSFARELGKFPGLSCQTACKHILSQFRGQQNAIAGYKPASFSEPPMVGDEICARQAVAIEENAIMSRTGADPPVADFAAAKVLVPLPNMFDSHRTTCRPILDYARRIGAGSVIGNDDFKIPIRLSGERP